MSGSVFGRYIKALRQAKGQTLRDFCLSNSIDPGNYSRLERGLFPPPQREELLEKYAATLGITRGGDQWFEFFDLAAAARGEIPADLRSDDEVLAKLPLLFRTLRGSHVPPEKLNELVERLRDKMSNVLREPPKFTPESWRALNRFEESLKERLLNLLEDRMRQSGRSSITDEDVQACVRTALEELLGNLTK